VKKADRGLQLLRFGVWNASLRKVNRGVSQQIHQLRREVEKEFPVVASSPAASLAHLVVDYTPGGEAARRQDVLTNLQLSRTAELGFGFVGSPAGHRTCGDVHPASLPR